LPRKRTVFWGEKGRSFPSITDPLPRGKKRPSKKVYHREEGGFLMYTQKGVTGGKKSGPAVNVGRVRKKRIASAEGPSGTGDKREFLSTLAEQIWGKRESAFRRRVHLERGGRKLWMVYGRPTEEVCLPFLGGEEF